MIKDYTDGVDVLATVQETNITKEDKKTACRM